MSRRRRAPGGAPRTFERDLRLGARGRLHGGPPRRDLPRGAGGGRPAGGTGAREMLRALAIVALCTAGVEGWAATSPGARARGPPGIRTSRALAPRLALIPPPTLLPAIGLNSAIAATGTARGQRVLTPTGLAHAWALGVILWTCLGLRGWSTCVLYLVGGSAVTKVRQAQKEAAGIAEGRGGARGPENVWGSAATAALCAVGAAASPARAPLLTVGFVASLATKLGDTFASELGKAYGKTTYLITTLRRCPPGTEGGVSLEGTAAGVIGSLIIAVYAIAIRLVPATALVPCVAAAFFANQAESLIGAAAQGRVRWLTNEVVNFANTLIGAAIAVPLFALLV